MGKIKVLDQHLINLISAGEVIERGASVVKELVENSIDAKATNITISLVDSGLKEIVVSDDGIGMDEVEMKTCILPHATSKISDENDLFAIHTLGFRGEALASIVAVSNVKIKSSNGESKPFMMGIKAGQITSQAYIAHPRGTEIQVRDLFYNTPARLQNLKSAQTELSYITDFVTKIAMANPDIAFKLINNENKIFQSFGKGNTLEVLGTVYDVSVAKNMIAVDNSNHLFRVSGLISNISITRSSRSSMTIIVNGRVVRNNSIINAILEGYKTLLMIGRYPICLLTIDVDYSIVDVNVHPTKSEVRFSEENQLLKLITETISKALYNSSLIVNNYFAKDEDENNNPFEEDEYTFEDNKEIDELDNEIKTKDVDFTLHEDDEINYFSNQKTEQNETINKPVQQAFDFIRAEVANDDLLENNEEKLEIDKITELHYIGQLFGTYLLAQNEDTFYLIDQHAANERVNYEKIINNLRKESVVKYDLIVPINLTFTPSESILINEKIKEINEIGIELDDFGGGSFVVRTVPIWINQEDVKVFVEEIIINIIKDLKKTKEEFLDSVSKSLACKRSVKANEFLSKNQITYLLEDLIRCNNPYTCPHGRPIIIKYTKSQVEKWFKRVL